MVDIDKEKAGLKSGLEIHQQLDVGKLFCNCPGYLRSDKPDFVVKRKLHKVAGELGEIDIAVEYEAAKGKEFDYEGYDDTTCLVELDEEPPRLINEMALDEAIKIALLLNCEVYPVSQIMRKTVIDGSNTSGFQRTVLIGHDGWVETSFGKVPIESILLEEDAARIIKKGKKKVVYRLDRLGIPMVEVTTGPVMEKPEQVREAALKIGEILRAAKVKRGIGTIRQDVNVSIKGHDKVEIKGFQDPRMMVKMVELEMERQEKDLKAGKSKGGVRNALPSGESKYMRPMPRGARMYPETDLPLLKISREKVNKLKKKLPKLRTEIRGELKKKGVREELINLVVYEIDEFETLLKVYDKDANLVAKMITLWRSDLAAKFDKGIDEVKGKVSEGVLEEILEALKKKKIDKGDKMEKVSEDEVEEFVGKIVKQKPGLRPNAYMGLVMKKFKGKIDAKKAMEVISKVLKGK
jgi:Glu-tRNA(Gln) amidotransferase subunit E-like FAD-binding protein